MLRIDRTQFRDRELVIGRVGQSNSRPWGHRDDEGYVAAPHLELAPCGADITVLSIIPFGDTVHGAVGSVSRVAVAETLVDKNWIGATLRLYHTEFGEPTKDFAEIGRWGHGRVTANDTGLLTIEWLSPSPTDSVVTFSDDSPDLLVTFGWAHGGVLNDAVRFVEGAGTLPTGIVEEIDYYLIPVDATTFKVALAPSGSAVAFTDAGSGTLRASLGTTLLYGEGYVFHDGKRRSYAQVRVLTPYQPEVPGDYPTGAPQVPGFSFPAEITSYEDAGLFFEWTWNEGLEGIGHAGTPATVTSTGLTIADPSFHEFMYAGGRVTVKPKDGAVGTAATGIIASNSATAIVLDADGWSPATPSGAAADLEYEIHVPHWRDNPNPEGFRYPSNDMQPGGPVLSSTGTIYNRPRGRLECSPSGARGGCYISREQAFAPISPVLQAGLGVATSGIAESIATGVGQFLPSIANISSTNYLRISRASTLFSPFPFELFVRAGHTVFLQGFTAAAGINRAFRVKYFNLARSSTVTLAIASPGVVGWTAHGLPSGAVVIFGTDDNLPDTMVVGTPYYVVNPTTDEFSIAATPGGTALDFIGTETGPHTATATTSFDLEEINGATMMTSVVAANAVGASIQRVYYQPQHRFGAAIEEGFRIANSLGKRVNLVQLGINSSGQLGAVINNAFGYPGRIGWWDDERNLTWTPSDEDSNFARYERMLRVMTPAALTAEGNTKTAAVIAFSVWNMEADALVEAGREMAPHTVPTFWAALRDLAERAGLNPYAAPAKIPIQHAQLSHEPWELEGLFYGQQLVGDEDGEVNAAIVQTAALDGFAAAIDTDDAPKLDGTTYWGEDPLHFNGTGEALNGEASAEALLPLIARAFSMQTDAGALAICNLALSHIGDAAGVTSLDTTVDTSVQARHCARFYPLARDNLLQSGQWGFAMRRVPLTAVTSETTQWQFAYGLPGDLLKPVAVLSPTATSDGAPIGTTAADLEAATTFVASLYGPQPFEIEQNQDGCQVLLTNQEDAELQYVAYVCATSAYSPQFKTALAWKLAGMLAGPLVKGVEGARLALHCEQMAMQGNDAARADDGNQRMVRPMKKSRLTGR